MFLSHIAGVINHMPEALLPLPHLTKVAKVAPRKSWAPASLYAQQATAMLDTSSYDALITVTGSIGATSAAFRKAKALSKEGPLVSSGFAEKRWRRIAPLTLLHHLHNQPLAAVAEQTNCNGPGLALRAGAQMMPGLLAQVAQLLKTYESVLVVFCEAADRDEEASKAKAQCSHVQIVEGAVAARFHQSSGEAQLSMGSNRAESLPAQLWAHEFGVQALLHGFELLYALQLSRQFGTPYSPTHSPYALQVLEPKT